MTKPEVVAYLVKKAEIDRRKGWHLVFYLGE